MKHGKTLITTKVGTAGWAIPGQVKNIFAGEGTHLERYAAALPAVEINSSFYRDHKPATYAKWSACVPDDFRFSVKLSRYFTQETRLRETGNRLRDVLDGIGHLGEKWGVLLVQLPPSLFFKKDVARKFIGDLREIYLGDLAWEPRHPSWSSDEAVELLAANEISRVIADPEPCPLTADKMKRLEFFKYIRLHGSPKIYQSRYSAAFIESLAGTLSDYKGAAWCIFDNTTYGFATENALELRARLGQERQDVLFDQTQSLL
jgi:uncharacterized protein YecE (DUF72 family)